MAGFKINLNVISSLKKILTFTYKNSNTDLVDELPTAISFFNNYLYEYSDNELNCLKHYHKLYKEIPKDIDYYFNIEKYIDKEGNTVARYCYPIGVGEDEVDALSTHLLLPSISTQRPSGVLTDLDGHFIKASNTNGQISFETIEGNYDIKVRTANLKRNAKLKNIVLSISINESPIPNDLKYSIYWQGVADKYHNQIQDAIVKKDLKDFNDKLAKIESDFYNSIKMYREYKSRLASAQKNSAIIDLVMKGASMIADNYSSDQNTNQLNGLRDGIEDLKQEVGLIKDLALNKRTEAQTLIISIRNIHIQNNIPINDDPMIIDNWNNILD